MYLDFKTWLPDDVLVKTDRMSMAVSVEARVPFLDHRLVEFAASLPATVKVQSLGTKALLRRALRHDLPARTLRRRKRAFLVPLRRWLDGELRDVVTDTLTTSGRSLARPVPSATATARLLDEQRRGRRRPQPGPLDAAHAGAAGSRTSSMRLLLLTIDFPPARGGVQSLLAGLADGLADASPVTVVTRATAGDRQWDATQTFRVIRTWPLRWGRLAVAALSVRALLEVLKAAATGDRLRSRAARSALPDDPRGVRRSVRRDGLRIRDPRAADAVDRRRGAAGRDAGGDDQRVQPPGGGGARRRGSAITVIRPGAVVAGGAGDDDPAAGGRPARPALGGTSRRCLQGARHGHPRDALDPGQDPGHRVRRGRRRSAAPVPRSAWPRRSAWRRRCASSARPVTTRSPGTRWVDPVPRGWSRSA